MTFECVSSSKTHRASLAVSEDVSFETRVSDNGPFASLPLCAPFAVSLDQMHLTSLPPPSAYIRWQGDPHSFLASGMIKHRQKPEVGLLLPGTSNVIGVGDHIDQAVFREDQFDLLLPQPEGVV